MSAPPLGLIEGFFGPPWPEHKRLAFAPYLREIGFHFYLYAPKAEPFLRKRWREPWSREFLDRLGRYSRHFRQYGLGFGVGLSPFELHLLGAREGRDLLREKLAQLEEVGLDLLGLFFDDMPVHEGLAEKQLEAIEVVRNASSARVVFCPAFYTPDPILEKVFGKRPERYWEEISHAPSEVDFAWTGPKVISEEISEEHLEETERLLRRKPFLWDNLFANDGPRNCIFLKFRVPTSRTKSALSRTSGWAWNPMNQAYLSRICLKACRFSLGGEIPPGAALEKAIRENCPPPLADFLLEHRLLFLEQGLDKIETETKRRWLAELERWNCPEAEEISGWLSDAYLVGSECLTD